MSDGAGRAAAGSVAVEVAYDPGSADEIWLSWPGHEFPRAGWRDLAAVVLAWWCNGVAARLEGSEPEDLCFMNGPYLFVLGPGPLDACEFQALRRSFDDGDPEVVAAGVTHVHRLAASLEAAAGRLLASAGGDRDASGPEWSRADLDAVQKSRERLAARLDAGDGAPSG